MAVSSTSAGKGGGFFGCLCGGEVGVGVAVVLRFPARGSGGFGWGGGGEDGSAIGGEKEVFLGKCVWRRRRWRENC